MKKMITIAACMAFVAALSVPAFAQPNTADNNDGSAVAQDQAIAVDLTANLEDNSTTTTTTSTANPVDNSINDSQIGAFTNSNNDNSVNVSVSDIKVAVASSVLGGTVTGNSVAITDSAANVTTGDNDICTSFGSAAGIVPVAQNTGIGSQIQQSVNVQSNLTME